MLAVILNQHLIKRRKQEEYKTAHSSPPDYETKNIVSSSDGVSCAEKDEFAIITSIDDKGREIASHDSAIHSKTLEEVKQAADITIIKHAELMESFTQM